METGDCSSRTNGEHHSQGDPAPGPVILKMVGVDPDVKANLSKADLTGADVSEFFESLADQAGVNLTAATMPGGTIHP